PVDFTYAAWLGDGRTHQPARVHFEALPAISKVQAWLQLPRSCGVRPDGSPYEEEQPQGDVAGLAGSGVRVYVQTQKPVTRARLEVGGRNATSGAREMVLGRVDLALTEDGPAAEGTFPLTADASEYRLVVEDQYGFRNAVPARRGLRVLAEEPPRVA